MEEETIKNALDTLNQIYDMNTPGPELYLLNYEKFKALMNDELLTDVDEFISTAGDLRVLQTFS